MFQLLFSEIFFGESLRKVSSFAGLRKEIEVVVELWLSLDVLSFKPAWRPGQKQNSLILALTLLNFQFHFLFIGEEIQ